MADESSSSSSSVPESSKDIGAAPVDHDEPGVDVAGPPRANHARGPKLERTLLQRALPRWGVVLGILAMLSAIYLQHPYYRGGTFSDWRRVFPILVGAWAVLGLPYVMNTLKAYPSRKLWFTDTGLLWLIVLRVAAGNRSFHVWKIKRLKNTILALTVKAFFSPLMVGFFAGHVGSTMKRWCAAKGVPQLSTLMGPKGPLSLDSIGHQVSVTFHWIGSLMPTGAEVGSLFQGATYTHAHVQWGLDGAYDLVFMVDCGFALVGYLMESRWLGNKTKSVEPTGFGWMVALACYPPFNNVLGTYMPFKDSAVAHFPAAVYPNAELWIKGFTVLLFTIYASATVAFGARFSNLTNRGIISRGPYRFIRHPAYVTKCCAWWLEHTNHMTIQTAIALAALCSVYGWRAWTEERHLSADPEYRAYKKKVPWVIFPKIY